MKLKTTAIFAAILFSGLAGPAHAGGNGVAAFNAALAASRARAGDVYVNGTANIAVAPDVLKAQQEGRRNAPTVAPIRIDPKEHVNTLNLVVASPSPLTVWQPAGAPMKLEILPVYRADLFQPGAAYRPFGAVLMPVDAGVADLTINQYTALDQFRLLMK